MDMSSLHNHLPDKRKETKNEDDLLSTFKAAALSVTNLYRQALTAAEQERQEGFQDAVEEMLMLLNDGITDIESLREWCIARRRNEEHTYSSSDFSEEPFRDTSRGNSFNLNSTKVAFSSSPLSQPFQRVLSESTDTSHLPDHLVQPSDDNFSLQFIGSPCPSTTKHRIILNEPRIPFSKKCRHF
ncbi:hypothetical protein PMAC_001483 [Pneumocystis sp. 'macacae']|nr:hypothetical protein PMAC_001483 [Pneumocystis sp. 'macacae']